MRRRQLLLLAMRISWGSFFAGLLLGALGAMFAADAIIRSIPSESLVTTQDLVFCVQGTAVCKEVGGLAAGTHLEVDSKEIGTLRFRVPGPFVQGALTPASGPALSLELRRRQP